MKTITIHVSLQFDADQIKHGDKHQKANQAIELLNLVLQKEPFGLGAQLIPPNDLETTET